MRRLLVCVLLSVLAMSSAQAPRRVSLDPGSEMATPGTESDLTISVIDALASNALPKEKSASVTVGIVTNGTLRWSKSYGYADMEQKLLATTDTVYRIGSVTKQFTALMLLQLVHAGKVHLSDPVEKYLPEINQVRNRFPGAPPITFMQLATHTSGLANEPNNYKKYLVGPVAGWEHVLLAAIPETKYEYEPGTRFNYSNIGYAILGAALGRAAGQPYTEYVREHIWTPLGMTSTAFEPDQRIRNRIPKGYQLSNGTVDWSQAERENAGRGYKVPNGAVYSTVGDLGKFVSFELGGGLSSVLPPEDLEANFHRIITMNEGLTYGYAVGYEVLRHCDSVYFGHNGGVAGYLADVFFNRQTKTGVIILRNANGSDDRFQDDQLMWRVFDKVDLPGRCAPN